jgi:hypothetical protein
MMIRVAASFPPDGNFKPLASLDDLSALDDLRSSYDSALKELSYLHDYSARR